MKAWSDELALFIGSALGTPDKYERAARGMADMCTYFREVVGARRRQPREDLISALVDAEQQGGQLSEEELVATCVLLLFAGHEDDNQPHRKRPAQPAPPSGCAGRAARRSLAD